MSGIYGQNRKVRFNYEILETFTAGIELLGFEAKAIRSSQISLEGVYATMRGNEAFLIGANITPLQPKNVPEDYDPKRNRKLLLTKKEIMKLEGIENQKGLTIVALSVYNKGRKIKIDLGIGRGRKGADKREKIKKREAEIEMERTLKR